MRVAILFKGDSDNQKGYFNSVRNRVKHLSQIAKFTIDIYLIQVYEPYYVRFLRGTRKQKQVDVFYLDGIKYNNLWIPFSMLDYLLRNKLKFKELISALFLRRLTSYFSNYDLILAHSLDCAIVASRAYRLYNIPYFVTWHGSDINDEPFVNKYTRMLTVKILKEAAKNFFVSHALLEVSNKLVKAENKTVLYNGVSDEFTIYPIQQKNQLRLKFDVQDKKVVAFVGGIVVVKNVFALPKIFKNISCCKEVTFWVIGDGKYRKALESDCNSLDLDVRFFGNQSPFEIPDMLNCVDVLILPSFSEGLPLVAVEALACGCVVFGSRVGGIPEAIGIENTFDLNDDFVNNLSKAVIKNLSTVASKIQKFDSVKFSWKASAENELLEIYQFLNINCNLS